MRDSSRHSMLQASIRDACSPTSCPTRPSGVRAGLHAMLSYARSGDTVIVVALDRLGRSAGEVTRTIADLTDRGIRLRTLKEGLDTGTATGRVVAHIITSLAQLDLEREHQRS